MTTAKRTVSESAHPSAVPHLTVAERGGSRQGGARGSAALKPRRVRAAAPRRADPIELLERQAKTRVPELVPIRYGRMLVSPFTFYRGAALIMASDLAATPALGAAGAVLRRRAPVELRRVRLARAAAGVRPQRLRRDAPRAVGVGRQAPGREHADRRAGQRLSVKDQDQIVLDTVAAYRTAMAELRGDEEPRRLVRPPGHRDRACKESARSSSPRGQARPRRRWPRRAPRTAWRPSPN